MNTICYISGPMTGFAYFNFPAFDAAKERLEKLGLEILSPADHDREMGYDFLTGVVKDDDPPLQDLLLWDLHAVARADALYMLEGWHRSPGARLEHDFARLLNKKVWFEDTHNQ